MARSSDEDFFVFAAHSTKKYSFLLLFWYTFRLRSSGFRIEVDVTLIPFPRRVYTLRTGTSERERRKREKIRYDSPSDVVEARSRVKRRTVRASEFFFFGRIVLVRVNVIPTHHQSFNQERDILVFEKQLAQQRGERGEESDGKRQSIAKRDRGRS